MLLSPFSIFRTEINEVSFITPRVNYAQAATVLLSIDTTQISSVFGACALNYSFVNDSTITKISSNKGIFS